MSKMTVKHDKKGLGWRTTCPCCPELWWWACRWRVAMELADWHVKRHQESSRKFIQSLPPGQEFAVMTDADLEHHIEQARKALAAADRLRAVYDRATTSVNHSKCVEDMGYDFPEDYPDRFYSKVLGFHEHRAATIGRTG